MAELSGEPVDPTLHGAVRHQPAADPGSQRDEHHVVRARRGTELPLGDRGTRGVVVDGDRCAQPFRQQSGDLEVSHAVEVGSGSQHSGAGHQPRNADPDAAVFTEFVRQVDEHVDQRPEAVVAPRGRAVGGGEQLAVEVERDALCLGAPDIDAHPARRPGGGVHASARTLSSRTVLRIRTSARRLTKPGSGIARSICRS